MLSEYSFTEAQQAPVDDVSRQVMRGTWGNLLDRVDSRALLKIPKYRLPKNAKTRQMSLRLVDCDRTLCLTWRC